MPELLMVVELGGYPDFTPLYRSLGYRVTVVTSGRKAISYLKSKRPAAVVAEFNYIPDFRDRMGWLESVLATIQALPETTRTVIFYQPDELEHFERLCQRFSDFTALPQPVDAAALEAALK